MLRWSARRGQIEPLAAIAAVFAVVVALSMYAGALDDALTDSDRRDVSRSTVESVASELERHGVVDPARLDALSSGPDGYRLNVTLLADDRQWAVGPTPPETAQQATERVSVRLRPTTVRPGRLLVRVWP